MKVKFKDFKSLESAVLKGKKVFWKNDIYIVQYWPAPNNEFIVHCIINDNNAGLYYKNSKKTDYKIKDFYTLDNKNMKLKKGSAEAKRYMASIRAKKKSAKKVTGVKKAPKKAAKKRQAKSIHKDTKSHNVKISVMSGVKTNGLNALYKDYGMLQTKILEEKNKPKSRLRTQNIKIFTQLLKDAKKHINLLNKIK